MRKTGAKTLAVAAVALLSALAAAAAPMRTIDGDLVPEKDDWSTMKMEAAAIRGEVDLHDGDYHDASAGFRDSLDESTQVEQPHSQVMGLDLLRSAELAIRRKDFSAARRHLELLVSRYPDTDWGRRGQDLLDALPQAPEPREDDDAPTPVVTGEEPAAYLGRMRDALSSGDWGGALEAAEEFSARYPERREAAEARLLAGALYLRDGQAGRAAAILRVVARTAKDEPTRDKARYLLGGALLWQGDAAGALSAVPAADPEGDGWLAKAQVWRAAALDKLGRRKQAAALYARVAAAPGAWPLKAFARAALAARDARAGRLARALSGLREAADEAGRENLDDLSAAASLSAAHLLYRLRRFDEAARAYAAFARRRPDDPLRTVALYQEGLCLKRLGRDREAAAPFEELVRSSPDSVYAADAHLQLGQLYGRLGKDRLAVQHYEDMGRAAPGEAARGEPDLLVAQVYYNAKRYKQAIPVYEAFLEKHPKDARAPEVEDLLLTSYWLGDRQDPGLERAVERYPRHAIVSRIRWSLAADAFRRRDFAASAQGFERFAAAYPKSAKAADALFYAAESREALGDPAQAAAAYRAFLARAPKDPRAVRARLSLAMTFLKEGDKRSALAAFERFLRLAPRDAHASACWFEVGRLRESLRLPAAAAYERVSPRDPNRAAALFAAARLYEKARRTPQALRAYEALRSARPAFDPARLRGLVRLGLLYELSGKPMKALPLYADVMKHAKRGSRDFEAARGRVEAITTTRPAEDVASAGR